MKTKVRSKHNILILAAVFCIALYVAAAYTIGARQDASYKEDYSNYNTAEDLIGQGKYDEAEKLLKDLITKYPDSYLVSWNFGSLRLYQGNYPEARQYYQKVIKQRPFILNNVNFLYSYGRLSILLGDDQEARKYLQRAEKLSTDKQLSNKIKAAQKEIDNIEKGGRN